ncbi:hypothetical protein FF36_04519 [Frankia torreyi]|uniref:Uncharacterized protein n=1 Tax=Frankia torreyi TaxID=1856 RepID=A0A0D8BB44_9ACTN|nr:hypothetical protein FF36_04519 [Frankia torreyi]
MTSPAPPSYTSVSLTLRPSRVVIVIDGGEYWSYWARRALYRASRIWGGGDFVVVPHENGQVDPTLLRGCQAYDPDFVVTYHPTVEDIEHFRSGSIPINGQDGTPLEGDERARFLDQIRTEEVRSPADETAREEIASVCSVYRARGDESITSIGEEGSGHFTDIGDIPDTWSGSVLACPARWGGLAGAATALHLGVAQPPERDAVEPELDPSTRHRLTGRLLDLNHATPPQVLIWHPGAALSVDPQTLITARERTTAHLAAISGGGFGNGTGLLVLGDTANDFALACLWQRTFGTAYWLPSVLGIDEAKLPDLLGGALTDVRLTLDRSSTSLVITSISRSDDDLAAARERIDEARPQFALWGPEDVHRSGQEEPEPPFEPMSTPPLVIVPGAELSWRQPASTSLAVDDHWEISTPVPVTVDATGTTTMSAPLPPPTLAGSPLSVVTKLNWHVDVRWSEGRAVRRRGTAGHELLVDPTWFPATLARSSRHGTSYQAGRFDFVAAGIRPENRLTRPRLRDLSLEAWIAAACRQYDMTAKASDAGLRAGLLAAMLGGRKEYADFFGGALLPALRAMRPEGDGSRGAYPDGDGVKIASGEGVLGFVGICRCVPTLTSTEVRLRLDVALRAGVLRRGLVLGCATCGRVQFQTVDRLGQLWTCLRCDAHNDLNQPAWRHPDDEPGWYYDLHPAGRELLAQHGDTVALLSAHLRGRAVGGIFDDVEEVEVASAGKPEAELDLVAYHDDLLTVAECKSSTASLTKRQLGIEVAKKCMAAAMLRADQILFATEDPEWSESQQGWIQDAVNRFRRWSPAGRPKIIIVAGLGTDSVQEQDL